MVFASWGAAGLSSIRPFSNCTRCSLMPPRLAKPTIPSVCLSNNKWRIVYFSCFGHELTHCFHEHSVDFSWKSSCSLHSAYSPWVTIAIQCYCRCIRNHNNMLICWETLLKTKPSTIAFSPASCTTVFVSQIIPIISLKIVGKFVFISKLLSSSDECR